MLLSCCGVTSGEHLRCLYDLAEAIQICCLSVLKLHSVLEHSR